MSNQGGKGGGQSQSTGQPQQGLGAPAQQGQNVYDQSSQGLTGAFNSVYGAMDQNANNPQGYDPSFVGQPNTIQSGIQGYMNPYTDQVIGNTMNDMERNRQMQLTQIEGQAANAGAFGGSRQGLVESELNRNTLDRMGNVSANMRNQAYGQAAGLAGQDINNNMNAGFANQNAANQANQFGIGQQNNQFANTLAGAGALGGLSNQAFNVGQDITQQQQQQGLMQQALNQSILDQGSAMYGQYSQTPQELLNLRLGSLGQNPLNDATTTTTTKTPGMFDYLSMGAGLAGAAMS